MTDKIDQARRSENMRRVRSRDTKPELIVRSIAHRLGYRFRIGRIDLPGRPDIVFPRLSKVILVHGCFWHRHRRCARTTTPTTRTEFWVRKFAENQRRDIRVSRQLRSLGWQVHVVWECETKDRRRLEQNLKRFLGQN